MLKTFKSEPVGLLNPGAGSAILVSRAPMILQYLDISSEHTISTKDLCHLRPKLSETTSYKCGGVRSFILIRIQLFIMIQISLRIRGHICEAARFTNRLAPPDYCIYLVLPRVGCADGFRGGALLSWPITKIPQHTGTRSRRKRNNSSNTSLRKNWRIVAWGSRLASKKLQFCALSMLEPGSREIEKLSSNAYRNLYEAGQCKLTN